MSRLRGLIMSLAFLGLFGVLSPEAHACPSCKDAVVNGDVESVRLQDGYSYSILFMLAVPLALLGAGGFAVARAVRNGSLPEF